VNVLIDFKTTPLTVAMGCFLQFIFLLSARNIQEFYSRASAYFAEILDGFSYEST
jgi:hypothetical protein